MACEVSTLIGRKRLGRFAPALSAALIAAVALMPGAAVRASGEAEAVEREYVTAPVAPAFQTWEVADGKSSVILPQVTFGIAVRMAVMAILAGNEA